MKMRNRISFKTYRSYIWHDNSFTAREQCHPSNCNVAYFMGGRLSLELRCFLYEDI